MPKAPYDRTDVERALTTLRKREGALEAELREVRALKVLAEKAVNRKPRSDKKHG
jgi:hypothetical protein